MTHDQLIEYVFFATQDPLNKLGLSNIPAATTLLYNVCDNDAAKFDEATRLIMLYVEETLKQVKQHPEANQ